jgi:transcriptional regulator with XRE-family HTH domain
MDPLQARAIARLESVRKERQLSQADVAAASGLTQGHISRVLRGDQPETAFWVIARIAQSLDVSLDWLTEGAPSAARADSEPRADALPPATRLPIAK